MTLALLAAVALTGGTIVDVSNSGRDTADIRDAVIVLDGGRIVAAGSRETTEIPAGAKVIRVDGAYVVPGLNDVFAGLNSQAQANAYLYMGVTSIVGLDEPGGRRGALVTNARPSPRIRPLGVVASPEEVDEVARKGARVLLLYYPLAPEQTRAVVRRARELGLATIGELGRTAYREATDAGVDAFVHSSRYALDLASPEMHSAVAAAPFGPPRTAFYQFLAGLDPDAAIVSEWAARLGRSATALIPTLSLYYLDLPGHENPWKEEIAAILDPKDIHLPADRETGQAQKAPGIPPGLSQSILRIEERYRRSGARYLAGSGTSAFGTLPGISLHNELRMLTEIGLTPRQALAAATSNVGEVFRWPKVGQVKPGYDADLLVVDADPTADIRNLKKVRLVVEGGELVDRQALLKPPMSLAEHNEAMRAAHAGHDWAAVLEHARAIVTLAPNSTRAQFNLACALALTGRRGEAIATLEGLAAKGVYMDTADEDLASLLGMPELERVAERFKALLQPLGRSREAFRLPDKDLVTEGIAYDGKTETFFVSSVHRRKILRVDRNGRARDFVTGQDAVLGLAADTPRRILWACTAALPEMQGWRKEDEGRTAAVAFDLDTGLEKARLSLGSGRHSCNDLAVSTDGQVFVSDTGANAILTAPAGASTLSVLVPNGIGSPQGIALSPDERALFVADYRQGIARVDRATGAVVLLRAPADASLVGIDGLARYGDRLVGVQNGIRPHRVVLLTIDGDRVTGAEVLERSHPAFAEPTLGTVVGRDFFFVAASQWGAFTEGVMWPPERLKDALVLELGLPKD
jgi:sugar lactone lactonase YvrE